MDKVYIVTEGEYSSYHIVRVFDNKDAAKEFIDVHKKYSDWSDENYYIEEYIINNYIPKYKDFIYISYDIGSEDLYISVKRKFQDDGEFEEYTNYYNKMWENYDGTYGIDEKLRLLREVNPNIDIEKQKKKYTKTCYDIANRIKYIRDVLHIVNSEEINKMINSK